MSRQDVEFFQSFVRRYVNRTVKLHFADVTTDELDLDVSIPRHAAKKMCLHKDTDTMTLTIGRLLFWWIETKGLLNEYIYGIPSTDFEVKYTYYPQVKLHFKEDRYESSTLNRKPVRSEITFRWRSEDFTTQNINLLATKIHNDFASPVFSYGKGRDCFTYWDDQKGYRFTMYVQTELEAKKLIKQIINIQDEGEPDWTAHLREHKTNENFSVTEYVRVMGENKRKPKRRPIGTVKYQYAELFVPGVTKPIILSDATSYRPQALRYG